MGVRGLLKFISTNYPNCVVKKSAYLFKNKVIAVDISLWVHILYMVKLKSVQKETSFSLLHDDKKRETVVVQNLLWRLLKLMELGIYPVFVFDGTLVKEKEKTHKKRVKSRKIHVPGEIYEICKHLFRLLRVPYLELETGDAEAVCAGLVKGGYADFACSGDSDVLLFGSSLLTINFKQKKEPIFVSYDLNCFLKESNLTQEQFVSLCILSGTDYNDGVCSLRKAKSLITNFKTIRDSLDEINKGENREKFDYISSFIFSLSRPTTLLKDKLDDKMIKFGWFLGNKDYKFKQNLYKFLLSYHIKKVQVEKIIARLSKLL